MLSKSEIIATKASTPCNYFFAGSTRYNVLGEPCMSPLYTTIITSTIRLKDVVA